MDINEFPEIPDQIITAARNVELVVFIGAGISQCLGGPSWAEFAEKILNFLCDEGKISYKEKVFLGKDEKNIRRTLSICWRFLESQEDLKPDWDVIFPTKFDNNIYDDLLEFKSTFITTNYDKNIDYAAIRRHYPELISHIKTKTPDSPIKMKYDFDEAYARGLFYYEAQEMTHYEPQPSKIFHLHGSTIDFKSMVVTTQQYLNAYSYSGTQKSPHRELLERIFTEKTLLFVGTSMSEYEILEYLNFTRDRRHFMLYPIFNENIDLLEHYSAYFNMFGINLIPYNTSQKGPELITEIIKSWKGIIGSNAGELATPKGLEKLDRVSF